MAFDGVFLYKIKQEIDQLVDGRVDKISQPTHDSIIVAMRSGGKNHKIVISAEPACAKMHITKAQTENPKVAPMFCMLLRKHLMGAKLVGTKQYGADRILELIFETKNEFGDRIKESLVCEIMGRRSNIILINENNKIIDAIKRVDFVTSEKRQILSGLTYCLPEKQDKLNPLTESAEAICEKIRSGNSVPLSKAVLSVCEGFSPFLAREISFFATGARDNCIDDMTVEQWDRTKFYINVVQSALGQGEGIPVIIKDNKGKLVEFAFIEPLQYPKDYIIEKYSSCSELLDNYYQDSSQNESLRQKSHELRKQVTIIRDRLERKIILQKQEIENTKNRDEKRKFGDIISANIYTMKKGDSEVKAVDFFSEKGDIITIPLDTKLTPSQNAQKYYSEYKKAVTAEEKLKTLIKNGEMEFNYIDGILNLLSRVETVSEIEAIRDELCNQGYIKARAKVGMKSEKLYPKQYLTSDGYTVYSGRNNAQNDKLTLKDAMNYDLWLHTQKIHGSHTIILSKGVGDVFPNRTIEEACIIAACNSSAADSGKIPVDYTLIKNVKKPNGAKPGMVIYTDYQTAYVTPDHELEKKLRVK